MASKEQESFTSSEYADLGYAPRDQGVYLQHHRPQRGADAYHFHPSIEVNFLQRCDMTYSFSGIEVDVQRNRFCVFWAAYPHRAIKIHGNGFITNIYISLSEFLLWPLPTDFTSALLSGAVISSRDPLLGDVELADRWASEVDNHDEKWQRLHALEIQGRLYRLAVDGWEILLESRSKAPKNLIGGPAIEPFERMLRYVATYYANPIKIKDVAEEGGVSTNNAIAIFRKLLGRTIKEHITDLRLFHARMLLSETDSKILSVAINSGFGSLSAFYEAFHNHTGVSPAAFRKGVKRDD